MSDARLGILGRMWHKTGDNGEDKGVDVDKILKALLTAGGLIFAAGAAYSRLGSLEANQIKLEVKVDGLREDVGAIKAILLGPRATRTQR